MYRKAIVIAFTATAATFAAAQEKSDLRGPADNPTPTVRILEPADGAVLKANAAFKVRIETDHFDFAYDRATTPGGAERLPERYNQLPQRANSGHVHVYLVSVGTRGEFKSFLMPQNFVMPQSFETKNTGTIPMPGLAAGKYKLLVELVADDHTPRIKHHPRDWPPIDLVTLSVR